MLDGDGVINGDEALDVVDGVGMVYEVEFHGEALGVAVALFGWKGIPLDVLDDFQLVDFEELGLEVLAVFENEDGWCAAQIWGFSVQASRAGGTAGPFNSACLIGTVIAVGIRSFVELVVIAELGVGRYVAGLEVGVQVVGVHVVVGIVGG